MKITLFTSNQFRHNYLINKLNKISKELYVVQECDTLFTGKIRGHYNSSKIFEKYFKYVLNAQDKLFGKNCISSKKINLLSMQEGDINFCSSKLIKNFLKSDIYIVTGSSYIKGELADFLTRKKALSIHMGLAPYYRGTDCNFWALYDGNPQYVGATIYNLSKGLDTGNILYHALPQISKDPFIYTMSAVKSAFDSLVERIKNKSIFSIKPLKQLKEKEIRYSKKADFSEKIINKFFKKKIKINKINFNISEYKDPFILK